MGSAMTYTNGIIDLFQSIWLWSVLLFFLGDLLNNSISLPGNVGVKGFPPTGSHPLVKNIMNMYAVPNPAIPDCPPGLEYLTQVDQLLIKQKVEIVEALVGFESNNKYEVRNTLGQNVFYAVEENDCLSRQCCGPLRPFTIRVLDNLGQEVITVTRPLKCMSCFFPCCLQELEVQAPPGNTIGYVVQQWHPFSPKFIIGNEHSESVLKIHGPFCGWSCLPDVDFEILTMDEVSKIGKISKQWSGLLREAFSDTDNFGIKFPMDLDVRMKAVMIGACFLIDFMFFESSN